MRIIIALFILGYLTKTADEKALAVTGGLIVLYVIIRLLYLGIFQAIDFVGERISKHSFTKKI